MSTIIALRCCLLSGRFEYLFLDKIGAVLPGYPDTTQDIDLFIERTAGNGRAVTKALRELGFEIGDAEAADIVGGRAFNSAPQRSARHRLGVRAGRNRVLRGRAAAWDADPRLPSLLDGGHH